MNLSGKVVLITGGAKRIGRAMSIALAQRGAMIAVHYHRSGEEAKETLREIEKYGKGVLIKADLSVEKEVAGIIRRASGHFGRVDILINNASIFEAGTFSATTSENWDRHFAVNLKAPFLLSQSYTEQVPENCSGKIIHITDWRGLRPGVGHFAYTLTKSALIAMTKSMARILAPKITVNAIALGAILPPEGEDEGFLARKVEGIPLKISGDPSDVVAALYFLLEGTDFVTGTTLLVDGGEHL